MAFIAADILATLSGPSGESGVRAVRETPANRSIGDRKSFSSAFRTARSEVGKSMVGEAGGARSVDKVDADTAAKEPKGLTGSTRPERSLAPSQGAEKAGTGGNDDKSADMTRADSKSSSQQHDGGADSQGQGPVPIASLMSAPAQPQTADQPEVQIETEPRLISDEASADGRSQHPLISHEAIESLSPPPEVGGNRFVLSRVGYPPEFFITRQSDPVEPQAHDDEPKFQGAAHGSEEVIETGGRGVADRGGAVSLDQDRIPRVPLSPEDPNTPIQGIQAPVGKAVSDGNGMGTNDETTNQEGRLIDASVPNQTVGSVRSLNDQGGALGASTEEFPSQGQQPDHDAPEQFSELWSHHNGRQIGAAEPKTSQPFVVDYTITHGSATPGTPSQAITAPGAPATTSGAPQVQPGVPMEEMARSTGIPGSRSVVVNVAQPDLGHVNIRVAMTNDVVHTYLSSDRLEVGQFFINGQDRLQTALQTSGLDLGQFRVDIDRQSGGRSFQQGSSQEQGQSWSQNAHGMGQEPHSEQQGQTRGTQHGLLNVVA